MSVNSCIPTAHEFACLIIWRSPALSRLRRPICGLWATVTLVAGTRDISTSRLTGVLQVPDEECGTKATIRVITGIQTRDTGKPMFPLSF